MDSSKPEPNDDRENGWKPENAPDKAPIAIEEPEEPGDPDAQPV